MADLTYLDKGAPLPEDHDWVFIEQLSTGFYTIHVQVIRDSGEPRVIGQHGPFQRLGDATTAAMALAEQHGIATVYLRGFGGMRVEPYRDHE